MVLMAAMLGCGGEGAESDAAPAAGTTEAAASVMIVEPADGSTLPAGSVTVRFEVQNLRIVAATVQEPGTGHHHLFIDTPVSPPGEMIPMATPGVVHLGQGQTEHMVEGLPPGEHTIIGVVADWNHIPLDPPVMDTVTFTIEAP